MPEWSGWWLPTTPPRRRSRSLRPSETSCTALLFVRTCVSLTRFGDFLLKTVEQDVQRECEGVDVGLVTCPALHRYPRAQPQIREGSVHAQCLIGCNTLAHKGGDALAAQVVGFRRIGRVT